MPLRAVDLLNAGVSLSELTVTRDAPYGKGPRRMLDVYRPTGGGGRPVIVWFYGGSWQTGRRQDYRFVAAALARAGCVVAVPDYRLAPDIAYPDFIADGAAAVAFARRHAVAWGGDPARVFAVGHSAGAYIAAMLALDPAWGQRATLAGAVGIAGPYDFLPIRDADIQAVFAPAADLRATQPIGYADGANAPLLLLHGEADRTCYPRNSLALAARVRAAGGYAMTHSYPHIGHIGIVLGFLPWLRWLSPVLADTVGFVQRTWAHAPARVIQPAE